MARALAITEVTADLSRSMLSYRDSRRWSSSNDTVEPKCSSARR